MDRQSEHARVAGASGVATWRRAKMALAWGAQPGHICNQINDPGLRNGGKTLLPQIQPPNRCSTTDWSPWGLAAGLWLNAPRSWNAGRSSGRLIQPWIDKQRPRLARPEQ